MLDNATTPAARQRQVSERLSAAGLGKRRRLRSVDEQGIPAVRRLCQVLPELGSLFVAFGRYLSSRPDLLGSQEMRDLAELQDPRPPLPAATVLLRVAAELGLDQAGLEGTFTAFDPLPLSHDTVAQEHRAQTRSGATVVVRYARPDLEDDIALDGDLLPSIGPAFAQLDAADLRSARDDFLTTLRQSTAFDRQIQDLRDWQQATGMAIPQVFSELSGGNILTTETLPGVPSGQRRHQGTSAEQQRGFEQAQRLAQSWLQQALTGPAFPLFSGDDDLLLLAGGQLGLGTGPFGRLPPGSQRNVGDFLHAVAADDPDRAVEALIRELDGGSAEGQHRFRQRSRQLVPLREGEGLRDDLLSQVTLYWSFAHQEGFRPRPQLVPFYRGLSGLDRHLRRFTHGDPLRGGLEATRLRAGIDELARVFSPGTFGAAAGDTLATLVQLPQQLDQLLSQTAEGGPEIRLQMVEPPSVGRRKDASAVVAASLLAMVGLALAGDRLEAAFALGPWFERLTIVLFVVLGIHLLKGLGRWA